VGSSNLQEGTRFEDSCVACRMLLKGIFISALKLAGAHFLVGIVFFHLWRSGPWLTEWSIIVGMDAGQPTSVSLVCLEVGASPDPKTLGRLHQRTGGCAGAHPGTQFSMVGEMKTGFRAPSNGETANPTKLPYAGSPKTRLTNTAVHRSPTPVTGPT
jgi:hypothetical protein